MHRLGQDAVRYWDRHVARFFWRRWKPVLFYFHPMEPHAPYEPDAAARRGIVGEPPAGSSEAVVNAKVMAAGRWPELSSDEVRFMAALYDAEVAALDRRLRRVFRRLRTRGLLEHAIVVVTADHGEEFGEHGEFQHGRTLYQESVRIPLIMVGPGLPAGRVVDQPVSIVDVAPTILDLVGLPVEPRFEGRSLLASVDGGAPVDVLLELLPTGSALDVRRHAAGLVSGTLALLEPSRPGAGDEVFDLTHDPGERDLDPPALLESAAGLRARLVARQRELATRAGRTETAPVDSTMRERLRALGYAD
jgi:arylsulfatase A-like enzyme